VGHPRHSNFVEGFPADDAGHRTSGKAILTGPLDYQRPKLSIGPVNKTGRLYSLSFCLLMQTRQNYAFGATVKRVFSRPIRDTGGAEHPHQPKNTLCTFRYSAWEFLMSYGASDSWMFHGCETEDSVARAWGSCRRCEYGPCVD